MSNAPVPQLPPEKDLGEAPPSGHEPTPPSGVRKMLDAFEERDLSRIRASAVLGGLFLALGTLVLLGLLGFATGLSVVDPAGEAPLERLAAGMGLWMAFASLVALFVGGYAAAKLGGAIRRGDGALAGALTWSVALVLAMFVAGSSASPMLGPMPPFEPTVYEASADEPTLGALHLDRRSLVQAAWGSFVGAVISLLAASFGGAIGAVGRRGGETSEPPRAENGPQIPPY